MDEKKLRNLALIVGIIGLVGLFLMSRLIDPPSILIGEISESMIDEPVKISGTLTSIKNVKTVSMAKIEDDSGEVSIVSFEGFPESVGNGDFVEVEGKVAVYEEKLEIIVSKIN